MNSDTFLTFINKHKFKHIQTSTHAHTAERFIQTFRMNLQRRLDATKESTDEWAKHVKNILTKYNNAIHNTMQIEPNKAKLPGNHLWAVWHLQNAANNNRTYDEIVVGNYVRVNIKPTSGITNGHHPKYYSTKHEFINIQGNDYLIDIMNKNVLYHRHELLLVK